MENFLGCHLEDPKTGKFVFWSLDAQYLNIHTDIIPSGHLYDEG